MKRIVITGAESTGKTTLTQSLSGYYGEPWSGEFVRDYVTRIQRNLGKDDLNAIAEGQFNCEDIGRDKAKQCLFHDTNILSSILYAKHYFDTEIEWVQNTFLRRQYDLYLLCMPDIPWEADEGQRESAEARQILHQKFKTTLDTLKLPYVEISGDAVARMSTAVQAIDALLQK